MKEKHGLQFDILRDEKNSYAEQLGLRFVLPDYLKEVYQKIPIDLARVNGEPSWSLAVPARLVVRRDGVVVSADYDPDYTSRPEPEKTLADLKAAA